MDLVASYVLHSPELKMVTPIVPPIHVVLVCMFQLKEDADTAHQVLNQILGEPTVKFIQETVFHTLNLPMSLMLQSAVKDTDMRMAAALNVKTMREPQTITINVVQILAAVMNS
jgi:hypothetical protein